MTSDPQTRLLAEQREMALILTDDFTGCLSPARGRTKPHRAGRVPRAAGRMVASTALGLRGARRARSREAGRVPG